MITGRDGQIRAAILRVASEKGQSTTLQRPLQRLYPLEIECYVKEQEGKNQCNSESRGDGIIEPVDTTDNNRDVDIAANRPKRKAAAQARQNNGMDHTRK